MSMSATVYACGCVETGGVRAVTQCTEGHTATTVAAPTPTAGVPSADEEKRIAHASAALARGEEPEDTRTPAEKRADKKAAHDA
jgi:hypothetical protein